jgi:hypothetical protein
MKVETIYNQVQFLFNQYQIGLLSPDKFNLAAEKIQADFLNGRIEALRKFQRQNQLDSPGAIGQYQDISSFGIEKEEAYPSDGVTIDNDWAWIAGISTGETTREPYKLVSYSEFRRRASSLLSTSTGTGKDYATIHNGKIKVNPVYSAKIYVNAYKLPDNPPKFNYTVVNNRPVYNAVGSVDFAIKDVFIGEVIERILREFGINQRDGNFYQMADNQVKE